MKHIEPKYILAFSLMTLGADSAMAKVDSELSVHDKFQKDKSGLIENELKSERNSYKRKFSQERKFGFDTNSLSDFFKKLRQAKNS
jgi:hypothetical protein